MASRNSNGSSSTATGKGNKSTKARSVASSGTQRREQR
jgi:hypothetical protein